MVACVHELALRVSGMIRPFVAVGTPRHRTILLKWARCRITLILADDGSHSQHLAYRRSRCNRAVTPKGAFASWEAGLPLPGITRARLDLVMLLVGSHLMIDPADQKWSNTP